MRKIVLGTQSFINRSECFNAYMRDIRRYDTKLTSDEEAELFALVRKGGMVGQRALDRIVTAHLLFVVFCAIYYASRCKKFELEDLLEQGNEGLIHAVYSYDIHHDNRFLSYAVFYIRLYILEYMRANGSTVYVPQNRQRQMQKYRKHSRRKMDEAEYGFTSEEFADSLGISVADADYILNAYNEPVRIDSAYYDDDSETTYGDMMASDFYADTCQDKADRKFAVTKALGMLTPKETYIMRKVYGIDDECECEHNYTDIANDMNVSSETVRLCHEHSLNKLRKAAILREYMAE